MLNFFKKLFRKSEVKPATTVRLPVAQTSVPVPSPTAVASVETASLSLASIIGKFPEDLKGMVLKMPEPQVTVVLPLPTILKQLPSGNVKMSLASLHRQAPPGVFRPMRSEDKRMVDVPLGEIFRRVRPDVLRRRDDQKRYDLPDEELNIFGDKENPYALAPNAAPEAPAAAPAQAPALTPSARVTPAPKTAPAAKPAAAAPAPAARTVAPPPGMARPGAAAPAPAPAPEPEAPKHEGPPLVLPVADLVAKWPEKVLAEIGSLEGMTVSLPGGDVSAGLAKGKVAFTWGRLREWLTPAAASPTGDHDATELILPLRTVAPAFLKHTQAQKQAQRKSIAVADDIPALFSGGTAPPPPAPEPVVTPEPEPTPAPAVEAPVAEAPSTPEPAPAEEEPVEADAAVEAPAAETESKPSSAPVQYGKGGKKKNKQFRDQAPTPAEAEAPAPAEDLAPATPGEGEAPAAPEEAPIAAEAEPTPLATAPPSEAAPAPETPAAEAPAPTEEAVPAAPAPVEEAPAAAAAPTPAAAPAPKTIGEVFGEPGRTNWSPAEIVQELVKRREVQGAVVALQEGLVIASHLPEGLKGDVFAAFLPQIFARLNQYGSEMKIGEIDDIVMSARGAHFQVFRLGMIFFAVLGTPGDILPWAELRLIADHLAQESKK